MEPFWADGNHNCEKHGNYDGLYGCSGCEKDTQRFIDRNKNTVQYPCPVCGVNGPSYSSGEYRWVNCWVCGTQYVSSPNNKELTTTKTFIGLLEYTIAYSSLVGTQRQYARYTCEAKDLKDALKQMKLFRTPSKKWKDVKFEVYEKVYEA